MGFIDFPNPGYLLFSIGILGYIISQIESIRLHLNLYYFLILVFISIQIIYLIISVFSNNISTYLNDFKGHIIFYLGVFGIVILIIKAIKPNIDLKDIE